MQTNEVFLPGTFTGANFPRNFLRIRLGIRKFGFTMNSSHNQTDFKGFMDLYINDQMRLLQSTWAEILTLTLAFRSLPLKSLGRLKFASDFTLDEKQSRDCGAIELYQICCHVVERLESLSVVKEEYYLLKALVLTNSDVKLDEYQSLKRFRDSILSSLSDAVGILRPTRVMNQMQQLLLVLRQTDHIVRRFWGDVHQQDLVPMNKLFLEMLEAHCR